MLLVAHTAGLQWTIRFVFCESDWRLVDEGEHKASPRCRLEHRGSLLQMIGESEQSETVYAFETDSLDAITSAVDVMCIVPHAPPRVAVQTSA